MESPLRITCLLVLDSLGDRICVKYLTGLQAPPVLGLTKLADFEAQRKFEANLHQGLRKIRGRTEAEVLQAEGEVAVGLGVGDVLIFASSPESCANELLLLEVVDCLRSVLSRLCNGNLSRQALVDNLDSAMLALDETADQGLLLELNPTTILARVNMQDLQAATESASFNQAITQAKDSLIKSLLSGAS